MNGRLKIVTSMLIWGSVGIFARFSRVSGLSVAFLRVGIGSLLLLILLLPRDSSVLHSAMEILRRKPKPLMALGTALALNWVFLFTAINYTTIANAVLVYYLAPVIATLISWRFLGERLSKRRWILIGMAFLGLLLIGSGQEIDVANRNFIGVVLAFIAAIFYAMIPNLGRFLRDVDGKLLTLLQLSIATLVLTPFIAKTGIGTPAWWSILVLVVVHTVLALFLYMEGLKEVQVNEAALLSYLDPLSAVIYALLIFGEVPGMRTVIGGTLILMASILDIKARGS